MSDELRNEPQDESHASPRGAHRDDLDYPVAEGIEEAFKSIFPGVKVVFAGDMPEGSIPEEVLAQMRAIEERSARSLAEGRCFDCDKQIPGPWPPSQNDDGGATLPEGWSYYSNAGDGGGMLICPECEQETPEV
jgi:hypothetical protein